MTTPRPAASRTDADASPPQRFPSAVRITVDSEVLPGRTRPSAIVRLDSSPAGGLIVWGSEALEQLAQALRGIDETAVEAIVVIGSERSFGAGADLDEIRAAQLSGDAADYIAAGHETFGILAEASVPTFSVLTGQALGGGLELALHTDHRIGHERGGPLGLPECRLGIFPGWGGVYLLPHLIGPRAAIRIAVFDSMKGRHLRPRDAAELGLLDTVLAVSPGSADWEEAWQRTVAEILADVTGWEHRRPGGSAEASTDGASEQEWTEAVAQGRAKAQALWRGAAPAPLAALELIDAARGQSRTRSGELAIASFADLAAGDVARASLRTYRLVDSRSRRPAGRPEAPGRAVRKVAVIGAGLMARQLAALFARSLEVPVVLTDVDGQRLTEGVAWVADRFQDQVGKGRLSEHEAQRLAALVTGSQDDADLADADFLIEATPEQMAVKTAVLSKWSSVLGPEAVIATNTSSLSVTQMAGSVTHPERFLGFHVFNPVDATPLLEIITTGSTSDASISSAFDLAAAMRRTPVRAADAPGFVVNRLLLRLFDPVLAAIESGADPAAADHALDPMGLPMTPLQLLDFVGPAVLRHVAGRMHTAYPQRFHDSPWLAALEREGVTRTLSEGASGDGKQDRSQDYLGESAERLRLEVVSAGAQGEAGDRAAADGHGQHGGEDARGGPEAAEDGADALLRQVQDALAVEIAEMLEEGVIASAEDVDVCMVLGANWPLHLGGITPYLDRTGASERTVGRRFDQPAEQR